MSWEIARLPELPDVEALRRVFARNALRKKIAQVVVSDARILGKLSARAFVSRLQGGRLVKVRRYGKHLMAELDHGGWLTLHFGMTGALQSVRKSGSEPPFTRVRLDFAGDGSLAYVNKRMIGRVGLAKDAADFIAAERLGPDALDRRFDLHAFRNAVLGLKRDVKSVLVDQQVIGRNPVPGADQPGGEDGQARAGPAQALVSGDTQSLEDGDQPRRGLGAADAERFLAAATQESRALPALPIAFEDLQACWSNGLLLPMVPNRLTAGLTVDANQQASARSGQVPAVTAARRARSQ